MWFICLLTTQCSQYPVINLTIITINYSESRRLIRWIFFRVCCLFYQSKRSFTCSDTSSKPTKHFFVIRVNHVLHNILPIRKTSSQTSYKFFFDILTNTRTWSMNIKYFVTFVDQILLYSYIFDHTGGISIIVFTPSLSVAIILLF